MTKEQIENAVVDIMIADGPDGHCDGSSVIADFIMAVLAGEGEKWIEEYNSR